MPKKLRPSSCYRWMNCPGSVDAESKFKNIESSYAKEGTAAHWVAEHTLLENPIPEIAPNGVFIDDEMIESTKVYVDDILSVCPDKAGIFLEEKININSVSSNNSGTPDCFYYDRKAGAIYVWDFKYGRGIHDNQYRWQLINYSIGIAENYPDAKKIIMRIIQPRAYHTEGIIREEVIERENIITFSKQLKFSAELTNNKNGLYQTGDWCKYCKAARECTTLQKTCGKLADKLESNPMISLSDGDISNEIGYLKTSSMLITERLDALETETIERIKQGQDIPGLKLQESKGRLSWSRTDEEIIQLGESLGVDLKKKEVALTPTQAKKMGVDDLVINNYTYRKDGSIKLCYSDKTIVSRIFSKKDKE